MLQQEVTQVSQATIQNHLALDYLLAAQGGICTLVNTTCCIYVNQDQCIDTDLKKIQAQLKPLYQVTTENTLRGIGKL